MIFEKNIEPLGLFLTKCWVYIYRVDRLRIYLGIIAWFRIVWLYNESTGCLKYSGKNNMGLLNT